MKKSYFLIIILGTVLVFSNSSHAADFNQPVTLNPGWNIVSTPRVLESHSFSAPETSDNFDIYVLSAESISKWATMADLGQSEFVPLFGYFINNKTGVSQTLQLNYELDPNPSERLFNMTFSQPGWHSIGIANPTYSVSWCPGINFADSNNVSSILNPIAGNHSTVIDFTDGNASATSVAVSDQWKAVIPDNLNDLRDLTDLKGYAVYITKAGALYSGFQNTDSIANYCSTPAITSFAIGSSTGVINESTHTIAVTVPFGTNVTVLVPTVVTNGASVNPASGATQNFTNPVTYTAGADGSTQAYVVTVTVAPNSVKAITSFAIGSNVGTVNESTHTIAATVPFGTDVTVLIPTIIITGDSVNPASGVARDFTSPATYTVTAANGSTQAYVVTVNIAPRPATLTLGLAGTPGNQTFVKGTTNVDMVDITFAAGQASDLRVTDITVTGYIDDDSGTTMHAGGDAEVSAQTIANAVTNVRLVEAETGNLIAGVDKITNNSLSVNGAGTMKFSFTSSPWMIPASATKTMLVRVDLTNNAVSGSNDYYSFDIATTGAVMALDSSGNTINASNATPNGGTVPTSVLTVANNGSVTVAKAPGNPITSGVYWGQTNAPFSKFRLTATDEGQYIEKLTIAVSNSTEATDAKANVKTVNLTYKNKAGSTLTSTQSFSSGASANFGWSFSGSGSDYRPYVPKGSNLDITVSADLRTKAEGATNNVYFSLDLSDTYNGSTANGFKTVGEGSGAVLSGASTGVDDVNTSNNMYVYRVYPKIDIVALASPYLLIGTPDVFKFTVTAMGISDSKLLFDGLAVGSGSFKFEVIASGEYNPDGTKTSFEVFDESNIMIDAGEIAADALPSPHASLTFDFGSQDIEIPGGSSKTFRIQLTNPSTNYSKTTTTGRAADYFQLVLRDEAGLINWVGNSSGSAADEDTTSVAGVLRNLPATGPTFQR